MREADDYEFLYPGGESRVYEIPGIAGIGLREELLRARREEDAGEVDDAVGVPAGLFEGLGPGEVSAVDGDVGG